MITPLLQFAISLLAGIALILFLSVRIRIPAFYSLSIACIVTGFGMGLSFPDIIYEMKAGFGNILKSLGFIIVLGTALGILLARTGSSKVMADFILKIVGEKNAALGISLTGFIVGLPIFCDSGYIVLNGLNHSISKRSGIPLIITSISLATSLYSVHCMIPPHPGISAAAATIGADYGKLMIYGIGIAIPAMLAAFFWTRWAGKKVQTVPVAVKTISITPESYPSVLKSFLPVFVPIALISIKSFLSLEAAHAGVLQKIVSFLGEPVIALSAGLLIAFSNGRSWKKKEISSLLSESIEKAGVILVIIGAGGAFGAILAKGQVGDHFSNVFPIGNMALLFPFLITSVLKTAQGSTTVAIITASSIMLPLLHPLGLENESGKLLCVLSMGAGSMMVSHVNDAYFWVITEFSGLGVKEILKVYSVASFIMGMVSFGAVCLLSVYLK